MIYLSENLERSYLPFPVSDGLGSWGPNIPVPDVVLDAVRAMTDPNMAFHIRPTHAVRQAVNASFTSVKVAKLEANVG